MNDMEQWLLANKEEIESVKNALRASGSRIDQYEFTLNLAGTCPDFDADARALEDTLSDEYKHYDVLNRQLQDLEAEAAGH